MLGRRSCKTCLVFGWCLTLFCSCSAKNVPYPHIRYLVTTIDLKHPFACFGNSSIPHAQMTCQLGRGAFTRKNDRGRLLWQGRFSHFSLTGGRLLRIFPDFAKNSAPGRLMRYTSIDTRNITVFDTSDTREGEKRCWCNANAKLSY